jgi:HEAT repeat protein
LLTAPVADVRIAALKALLTIDPRQAGPHLAAATRDPDKAVRRRASLLGRRLGHHGLPRHSLDDPRILFEQTLGLLGHRRPVHRHRAAVCDGSPVVE